MLSIENDHIHISFQWVIGDTHPLEKAVTAEIRAKHRYLITIVGRIAAYGLTLLVVHLLLPEADPFAAILIAIVGSLSVWVSWGISIASFRTLERLLAKDAKYVSVVNLLIDNRGLFWSDEVSQEYTSWQGIKEIDAKSDGIWLKTGKVTGHYIPPRLFQDSSERKQVLEKLKYLQKHALLPVHTHGNNQAQQQANMH